MDWTSVPPLIELLKTDTAKAIMVLKQHKLTSTSTTT